MKNHENKINYFNPLLSLFISCKPDVKEILQKSFKKCQSIQNGYYEMTRYTTKLEVDKDTPESKYTCYFDKSKNDSIYSSAFHLKHYKNGKCKSEIIYTGEEFVIADVSDSTATIMSSSIWAMEIKVNKFKYPLYSPFHSQVSSPLPQDIDFNDGKHFYKFIGEETINNILCYHIQSNETPVDEKDSPIKTIKLENNFWISKSDFIPIQYSLDVIGVSNSDTIFQYSKDVLTKYEINNLNDRSILTLQSIPANYKIIDFEPDNEFVTLLSIGSFAPNWQLTSLTNEKINLTDLKGKYVLVYFFFKGCYPCIMSMPALQALHDKFNNKGLKIIGIDPLDENERDIADFIAKRGVNYTILVGDEKLAKEYHVKNYPTIYLLDKNGKIIYAEYGYRENLQNIIEEIILKKI
ncbi:MAG: redoxin domain-containing protein [Saprospiraceae bacterium]|nr:redoxin domain-containing protein [Saprospiraceae bacterium]